MQVDLACKILDGGPFRDDPSKVIMVQPAKFEMHGETYVPKKKKQKKKKKVVQEDKVLGWGGFDDMLPPTQVRVSSNGIKPTTWPYFLASMKVRHYFLHEILQGCQDLQVADCTLHSNAYCN